MDTNQVAQAFVKHYYATFDSGRQNLANIYQNESILTWTNNTLRGRDAIVKHLIELPFQKVQREYTTISQPSISNGILVFVYGTLAIDGNVSQPLKFAQTFHLVHVNNQYLLLNDIFQLILD